MTRANLKKISDFDVRTYITRLYDVVLNRDRKTDTDETLTDLLMENLLRVAKLNAWPLRIG